LAVNTPAEKSRTKAIGFEMNFMASVV